jgi:hypothetical protein
LAAALALGCASQITVSTDPEANYLAKFAKMPEPRPEVVHSRVEHEDPFLLSPRHREWEFELFAAPGWVDALRAHGFEEVAWSEVWSRPDIPGWFAPDAERYSAWIYYGPSRVPSASLFVERRPADPARVRVFVRRH